MKRIIIPELHETFRRQGVSGREHIAFKCCVCETVQSIASLVRAGCPPERAEQQVGFSCEGRWSKAGAWPNDPKKQAARRADVERRGCDWTLGGLFRIHTLEVINDEGKAQAIFEPATPEEAQALEKLLASLPAREIAS